LSQFIKVKINVLNLKDNLLKEYINVNMLLILKVI